MFLNTSFPNVKEITESMAAYAHTSKHILSRFHDSPAQGDVKDAILCVGDGSTPRSAALFALFFPNWECYSIDPQLQEVRKYLEFASSLGIHQDTCERDQKAETQHGGNAPRTTCDVGGRSKSPHRRGLHSKSAYSMQTSRCRDDPLPSFLPASDEFGGVRGYCRCSHASLL